MRTTTPRMPLLLPPEQGTLGMLCPPASFSIGKGGVSGWGPLSLPKPLQPGSCPAAPVCKAVQPWMLWVNGLEDSGSQLGCMLGFWKCMGTELSQAPGW